MIEAFRNSEGFLSYINLKGNERRSYTLANENQKISPKGKALYPKLWVPDRFDEKSEAYYKINVQFNREDTLALLKLAQKELEKGKNADQFRGKKWAKEPNMPYKEDDNGDVTFTFHTKAEITNKKTGETTVKPPVTVFDAKNQPYKGKFGSGSTVRIAFSPTAYNSSIKVNGVGFYLDAVQLLDLVEFGGAKEASFYGFETDEEGFVADTSGFEDPTDSLDEVDESDDF